MYLLIYRLANLLTALVLVATLIRFFYVFKYFVIDFVCLKEKNNNNNIEIIFFL